ncbi:MAG: nitroreductase [Betaproteobacteria bacterium]|nr:nitroreductase [Betaproteobacteria bacterium]
MQAPNPSPALTALLSRYSLGIKHLGEPGPDGAQLQALVDAALRAPDHAELVPLRLVAVQGAARERLASLFEQHARAKGKDDTGVAIERERALKAPLTLAVLARIDMGHPLVPAHEQWMCVGGAVANILNAAHAMGYAGKMLSGDKARSPSIAAAFCAPGETLAGWISIGTPLRAVRSGHAKPQAAQVLRHWEA